MTFSGDLGNWFDGHERHAELLSALGEVVDHALAVTLLEIVLALIGVLLALGEHGVDEKYNRSLLRLSVPLTLMRDMCARWLPRSIPRNTTSVVISLRPAAAG